MSAAFTPGPWRIASWVRQRGHFLVIDASSAKTQIAVADDEDELVDSETAKANARLIASAPELHEQVDLFIRCIEYQIKVAENKGDDEGARLQSMTLAIARSVAAKARGQ